MSTSRWLCVAVVLAGGCKLGDDHEQQNQGTGDPKLWTLTASFSRPDLTIQHGSTDTTTVVVTRGGGFTGSVTLETPFVPPGMTATLDNIVTTGTTTTARLSVTPGTGSDIVYSIPIPVGVSADGVELHAEPTVNINVTRKNGFWVTAPTTISVARGGASGPINVHFTKTGFTSDVTMSIAANPNAPGITGTFTPNPIAVDTNTTMTILVDASVVEGTYSVGVRANGGGYQGTAPMSVTVTAAGTLSMVPASPTMTVTKGTQGSNVFTLNRVSLPQLITMSSTSTTLPASVTVSFGPNPAGGTSTTMFVNVPPLNVQSGTYVINVTSGGSGVPVVTVPITLTIP